MQKTSTRKNKIPEKVIACKPVMSTRMNYADTNVKTTFLKLVLKKIRLSASKALQC